MTFAIGGTAKVRRIVKEPAKTWTCDHCTITVEPTATLHERVRIDGLGHTWEIRVTGAKVAHRVNGSRYKRCPGCGRRRP